MDLSYHLGGESSVFTDWCKKNYGKDVTLRINATWDNCQAQNTHFTLNSIDHPYTDFNKDLSVKSGSTIEIKLIGDSSAHVFKVDDVEVGYPITYDIPAFTASEDKTISVAFAPHYI